VARELRYRCLAEAATRLEATTVATAHTLDDQAETVLLRLLRGTGVRGASAIRRTTELAGRRVIRPLLDLRRASLRLYLEEKGEPFCEDSSNLDRRFARNRIRHELLPVIERVVPGGLVSLARFASLAAADEACLERFVSTAVPSVVFDDEDGVQLDADRLSALPVAVSRRVVRRALERADPTRAFSARHVEAVLRLASRAEPSGRVDLPRVRAVRRATRIRFEATGRPPAAISRPFDVPLPVPGRADVPEANLSVIATSEERGLSGDVVNADLAVVQAGAIALPLRVRSRQAGDRLRPLGAPGHRKLQDVLVDRRVPRDERDGVPLVVDAAGRIVWVGGLTIADWCRVTAPSAGVVVLKLHRGS
jgi:tRNA(Ile)-lysidine synthase